MLEVILIAVMISFRAGKGRKTRRSNSNNSSNRRTRRIDKERKERIRINSKKILNRKMTLKRKRRILVQKSTWVIKRKAKRS